MTEQNPRAIAVEIAEDAGNSTTLTIAPDGDSPYADCTSGPDLSFEIAIERHDVTVGFELALDEDETVALINALTAALEIERQRATERGYYIWLASDDRDEYGPPPVVDGESR